MLVFLSIYYIINLTYRYGLDKSNQEIFKTLVHYADKSLSLIPLSFVLGFFVSNVMSRWFTQFGTIPWPAGIAVYVSTTIHGYDEVGRAMRRTIMRYTCLSLVMVFRVLSPQVQRRYPTMESLIDAGLLHENEMRIIEDLERKYPGYSKNFLPIVWASSIVTRARKQGRIYDDYAVKTLIKSLNKFRGNCGMLMAFNSISIPLVYTQVVTIATYSYFLTMVMAQQVLLDDDRAVLHFPVILVMLFIFNMGWLKVAEALLNPFGEDDDDFDLNFIIDKNLTTCYLIVDDMHNEHPELVRDHYWDNIVNESRHLSEASHEKDFIDFDEKSVSSSKTNMTKRKTLSIDEENTFQGESSRSRQTISEDMRPRKSVIDAKYIHKMSSSDRNILKEQRRLEKKMEKIRRQNLETDSKVSFSENSPETGGL